MSLVASDRNIQDEVLVMRRQIKTLQTEVELARVGLHRIETGHDKHEGNNDDDDDIYRYDDTGLQSALNRLGMMVENVSMQLQQFSAVERRITVLESAGSLRTVDFNIQNQKLNSVFVNLRTYKAVATYSDLFVNYVYGLRDYINTPDTWVLASVNDRNTRAFSNPIFTAQMFHLIEGLTYIFPGMLQFAVTYVRQRSWGGDSFDTRMTGKGGLEPDDLDFYPESASWKTAGARASPVYQKRRFRMREGELTQKGKNVQIVTNLVRYAGAGALAVAGARFGPSGLVAAGFLSEQVLGVDLATVSAELDALSDSFDTLDGEVIRRLAKDAVTLMTPAVGELIPSDFATVNIEAGLVTSITRDEAQGFYLDGGYGGGPTNFRDSRAASFVDAVQLSDETFNTDSYELLDFAIGRLYTRYRTRMTTDDCKFQNCATTVPDYELSMNLSPNVCGSDILDWKAAPPASYSLHDGDGILLGGLLYAVFDYSSGSSGEWKVYDETGTWTVV
jgi:hypothetical protein